MPRLIPDHPQVHAAPSAAEAYRARVAAFLSAPGAAQRPRQALRLAANTDIAAKFAGNLLRQLPLDMEADPPVPPASVVSPIPLSAAVDAERARIVSILIHTEAEGREHLARTLVFETSADVATALSILAGAPRAARIPTVAERAAGQAEFGPDAGDDRPVRRSAADAAWDKALHTVGARGSDRAGQGRPGGASGVGPDAGPHWTAGPVMTEAIRLAREGFGDG